MTFNHILDVVLTLAHLVVILFNVFGWIWPSTRKLHLIVIGLTALSWFFLGIWFGWGYCFLTDWHWNVKSKLGEDHLPNSFIKYFGDKITGMDLDVQLVDNVTLFTFLGVILISVYLNFFRKIHT
jgi:hypothetical protein